MLGASIHDDGLGMPVLEIFEDDGLMRVIPMKALATYSELWGIDDPVETLEALIADQDRPKGPDETSPYKDAYTLLEHREKAREKAVKEAKEKKADKMKPSDPRSPELAGVLAAYQAVHVPVAPGEECAMDRCRREVREKSGIPFEPSAKCGATSRQKPTRVKGHEMPEKSVEVGPPTKAEWEQERRAQFSALLGQVTWMMDKDRREFLHRLSGNEDNPLEDVMAPVESAPDDTAEDLLGKYGAANA